MRRTLFGLLTLVAIAGLVTTSCQRDATLRVVSINGGNTLQSDIADFYQFFDKEESLFVIYYQHMPDSVQVVLQYVEIGAGLPTWTPYEALINTVTIKCTGVNPDIDKFAPVSLPVTQSVMADPTGKKVTSFYMTAVSGTFKQTYFGDLVLDPITEGYDLIDVVNANIEFSGYDSVVNRPVKAAGKLQMEFGNFYDDINRFGK